MCYASRVSPRSALRLGPLVPLLGFLLIAGCAHQPPRAEATAPSTRRHAWLAEGTASFYGPGLWGNKTASGERLKRGDFTAASRTLSFGTCLDVLNLDNGKRVRVRVNDRGPYAGHRLIDVSYAAGRALGMLEHGLARVRLFLCGHAPVDARAGGR